MRPRWCCYYGLKMLSDSFYWEIIFCWFRLVSSKEDDCGAGCFRTLGRRSRDFFIIWLRTSIAFFLASIGLLFKGCVSSVLLGFTFLTASVLGELLLVVLYSYFLRGDLTKIGSSSSITTVKSDLVTLLVVGCVRRSYLFLDSSLPLSGLSRLHIFFLWGRRLKYQLSGFLLLITLVHTSLF